MSVIACRIAHGEIRPSNWQHRTDQWRPQADEKKLRAMYHGVASYPGFSLPQS